MEKTVLERPQLKTLTQRVRPRAKFFFEGERKFFVKGVTYGPFRPNEEGFTLPGRDKRRTDFELMRELGVNLLRVYHVPPQVFLDECGEQGIRVLVSIPWSSWSDFFSKSKSRREAVRAIRNSVRQNSGHNALFGYLVGNEIPSPLVRFIGPHKVMEFLEELVEVARDEDPELLYSYASYPPTEYLLPQNVDFFTFNVYLHHQDEFERYLLRLQNLAEDRPLILGEFGIDTIRHAEEEQAEILTWHLDSVVRCGLAGTIFFSFTDEWFTNNVEVTDWAFGLVTRERAPKKSFHQLKGKLSSDEPMTHRVKLSAYPKVSVIVCSYNGARTLEACLRSLLQIDYPNYEIILVDDGSTDNTQEIVKKFPDVKNILQPNMGLSYARNAGAAVASGDIFAYTDSDCMADRDWLYYLVGTLLRGDYAGVGGSNISPPAENWVQACVAAAPGGPSHVLLTDIEAEHVPGCNMAFHRWAFERVGGFDAEYRKAGDDVDFCWRLQQAGEVVAFSAAAVVWHHRRFTLKAFFKQQEGYGEAESMLRFKHLIFFGPTGTAKWKGQVYGAPRFSWLVNKPIIYHGVFAQGLFQSIYPRPQSDVAAYLSSIEWVALTLFIFIVSIPFPVLRIVPYLMFGGTFLVALSYMLHARLEPKFDTIRARLLVAFLALVQPLVRGWARYFTWLKFKRTPREVIAAPEVEIPKRRGSVAKLNFWSEEGTGRDELLQEIFRLLEREGWRYSTDTGWGNWDAQIYGNFWWIIKLRSVTEYHGGPRCLTRVRLENKMVATTVLMNLVLLSLLLYQWLSTGAPGFWLPLLWVAFAVFLAWRVRRLKGRVADLVSVAATHCRLQRLIGKSAASGS